MSAPAPVGSPAYIKFKGLKDLYNTDWGETEKQVHTKTRPRTLLNCAVDLMTMLEGYLKEVTTEIGAMPAGTTHPNRAIDAKLGHSMWVASGGMPTIKLRHSKTGSDEFSTELTWDQLFAFVWGLRCVIGHPHPEETLAPPKGSFLLAARQAMRTKLDSFVYPPDTPMWAGSSVTLPLKRRHQWAQDMLLVMDLMEARIDVAQRSRVGIADDAYERAIKGVESDKDSLHWFFRTWLSRMVAQLAHAHIKALEAEGVVPPMAATGPAPRFEIRERAASSGSNAAPADTVTAVADLTE